MASFSFSRRAILIESSNVKGLTDLPGARLDVANFERYLRTLTAGAWYEKEITVLRKPSWTELKSHLDRAESDDYVFITFSGHGHHRQGADIDESFIRLDENSRVPVRSVNPGNPRFTFVVDSCRGIVTDDMIKTASAFNEAVREFSAPNILACRQAFADQVTACEKGAIRMYSCDIDEAAGESSRTGGYYSSAIITCCETWGSAGNGKSIEIYTTAVAHSCAANRVTAREPQQHPQYAPGRRMKHFPIAVPRHTVVRERVREGARIDRGHCSVGHG